MMANKSIGFYLSAASAVLAVISVVLYGGVLYQSSIVTGLLVAAIVVCVAAVGASFAVNGLEAVNLLPAVSSVLLIVAAALAAGPMVREVAYVYAGLNPMDNLQGWIIFTVVTVVAWLVSVVATFGGVTKK